MKQPANDAPLVLGQRLSNHVMDVLETLVFEFSALQLNECGRMVGGWLKSRGGGLHPPSPTPPSTTLPA